MGRPSRDRAATEVRAQKKKGGRRATEREGGSERKQEGRLEDEQRRSGSEDEGGAAPRDRRARPGASQRRLVGDDAFKAEARWRRLVELLQQLPSDVESPTTSAADARKMRDGGGREARTARSRRGRAVPSRQDLEQSRSGAGGGAARAAEAGRLSSPRAPLPPAAAPRRPPECGRCTSAGRTRSFPSRSARTPRGGCAWLSRTRRMASYGGCCELTLASSWRRCEPGAARHHRRRAGAHSATLWPKGAAANASPSEPARRAAAKARLAAAAAPRRDDGPVRRGRQRTNSAQTGRTGSGRRPGPGRLALVDDVMTFRTGRGAHPDAVWLKRGFRSARRRT